MSMTWKRSFDDPVVLPDGRKLVTLEDVCNYITRGVDKKIEHQHDD